MPCNIYKKKCERVFSFIIFARDALSNLTFENIEDLPTSRCCQYIHRVFVATSPYTEPALSEPTAPAPAAYTISLTILKRTYINSNLTSH